VEPSYHVDQFQGVRSARPADPEGAVDIARRSYQCRSQLTHRGTADMDLSALFAEALPLTQDMIRVLRPQDPAE